MGMKISAILYYGLLGCDTV